MKLDIKKIIRFIFYVTKVVSSFILKSMGFGLLLYILWNDYLAYQFFMVGISYPTMILCSGALFFIIDPIVFYLKEIYLEQRHTNKILLSLCSNQTVGNSTLTDHSTAKEININVDKTD